MSEPTTHEPARRGFFRQAIARVVQPLAEYIEAHSDLPVDRPRLRPPGAIEERAFLETCYRCGACAAVCPAQAIFLLDRSHGDATGTPVIDADRAACVVCDGLRCTEACVSHALVRLEQPSDIAMGLASVYASACVRSTGQDCTKCVDSCPLGDSAIRFSGDGPPEVLSEGCVGCGVCQLHCPTSPKAITVEPG